MIIDLQSRFSGSTTAAGVTIGDAVTVTAISANVLDLRSTNTVGPTLVDEGIQYQDLWLIVQCDQSAAFAAAGAATLTITLESDSTANLATTPAVHYSTAAIPKATLVQGYTAVRVVVPSGDYQRYVGTRYTVATGPFTAGGILAFLTFVPQRNVVYPIGFAVN
jgi:hypothetical protein